MRQPIRGKNCKVNQGAVESELTEDGFTLVEVMISVVITAIGITAVFGFIAASDEAIQKAQQRERLDMIVTDIIETVVGDKENITEYSGKNLSACAGLTTSSGKAVQLAHLKRWCSYLDAESGVTKADDIRKINITQKVVGTRTVNILTVELTSADGKNTIFAKRTFDAPDTP
jgi:prepilin-type N-terminal cleavage/methylation domain-containing protein